MTPLLLVGAGLLLLVAGAELLVRGASGIVWYRGTCLQGDCVVS